MRADDQVPTAGRQGRATARQFAQRQVPDDPHARRVRLALPRLADVDELETGGAGCRETRELELQWLGLGVSMRVGVPRLSAAFAVHPAAVAVRVVLLLPDRYALLDLVDHVATRAKASSRCAALTPTQTASSPMASSPTRCTQATRRTPKRSRASATIRPPSLSASGS